MHDFAIVGAGINGTSMAHFLSQSGAKVLLIDKEGIASGGSGAAGAFLAPKIGKNGELQDLINRAFDFSLSFYAQHFSHLLTTQGLLHLPKYGRSTQEQAREDILDSANTLSKNCLKHLKDKDLGIAGAYFPLGSIIEPDSLCRELAVGSDFVQDTVKSLVFRDDHWVIDTKYRAKHIIFASGAENFPLYDSYMRLRPIWGERIEITSSTTLHCNYHQNISVSATKANGHIVIGATHEQNTTKKPLQDRSIAELLSQADKLIELQNITVVDHRGGVRSGTIDYYPVVGPIVNAQKTLQDFPNLIHGAKVTPDRFSYYPNMSIINGVGGRGFVLAPFLAKLLSEHLLENRELYPAILPTRLFARWAKKELSLKTKDKL